MAGSEPPSDDEPNQRTSGILLAIGGTFLFALKSIFIKLAFAESVAPETLLAIRMFLALPFYIVVLWRCSTVETAQPTNPKLIARAVLIGFLGYYLAAYLDFRGLEYISAQLERLTLFTYPAMIAVLAAVFLSEPLNRNIVTAIGLCYLGVFLMYGQERAFDGNANIALGVALVAGAALSYSLYILFAKPIMQVMGSQRFTSLAMIGSTVFVGIHFLCTRNLSELGQLSPLVFAYGVALAFVCTVIPSFMINEAIVRIGATRTTLLGTVGPVLTMLLAIVLLDEPSSVWHFVGMAVAIVGVSLVARK